MEETIVALLVQLEEAERLHSQEYSLRLHGLSAWTRDEIRSSRKREDLFWDQIVALRDEIHDKINRLGTPSLSIVFKNREGKLKLACIKKEYLTFHDVDVIAI